MKAIIVGAGPAGLAAAACLKQRGVTVTLLDRAQTIASSWRNHYDSLHLHTARGRSTLPGLSYPKGVGKYPSREQVIAYLDAYAQHHGLAPRLGCTVTAIARKGAGWCVTHSDGAEQADIVVVATSVNGRPKTPDWPGTFDGPILHSTDYRNAGPFAGRRVLVVGFGNSGGDIALDLSRAGVDVTVAVRSPVNILPKELFGVPITSFGLLTKLLGYRTADILTAPILRLKIGQAEDYGLHSMNKGPGAMVQEDGRIPMIDVGALGAIKAGRITVKPGVKALAGRTVRFDDDSAAPFDTIIAAIGYKVDLRPLLGPDCAALDPQGRPTVSGGPTAEPGLYFCSFRVSPDGQLFATSREAKAIAADVADTLPRKGRP
ncbi:flavin-containing monooxygenase [Nioella nitratireducens]|uniref:flavin-containing monooxygenase n=1 Tax=Nioella nitratireducens TaxID=1287720 RepID=UPI0008FD0337|nr:NAD(P)/FAD-dependent oxidoreductase [Nioella nitratireducens]